MSTTLLCADYPRVMPLATGAIPADFQLSLGRRGSWPDRAEILSRSLTDSTLERRLHEMAQSFAALQGCKADVEVPGSTRRW